MFRTIISAVLVAGFAVFTPSSTHAQNAISLHKGINVFPWLYRARMQNDTGQYYLDQSFPYANEYSGARLRYLRAMGFDFIRIPIEPNPFLMLAEPQRGKLISQVLAAVDLANAAGLTVVVDFHPREARPNWRASDILASPEKRTIYRDVLVDMAETLVRNKKNNVVLELMNEPPGGWGASDEALWRDTQNEFVKAVRKVAPTLPLILTGDGDGGIKGLMHMDSQNSKDLNIFYSFHYYTPMIFTHQGATWTIEKYRKYLTGIEYPPVKQDESQTLLPIHAAIVKGSATPSEASQTWGTAEPVIHEYFETQSGKKQIEKSFAEVTQWAKSHQVLPSHILLGEFGVERPGPSIASAANYLNDVRTAAENAGFAWAFFNYDPGESGTTFSMMQLTGSTPTDFSPEIVKQGLGLSLPDLTDPHSKK